MADLVDVGGYRLAISIAGSGTPPVVFVSGRTGAKSEWEGVQAAIEVPTALVAYARPALGGSDPLPPRLARTPRSSSWAADQLRTLLKLAGVAAPRVLAGHSIGGLIVEAYAARWPEECAGLVLVDPTDPRAMLNRDVPRLIAADDETDGIRFDLLACQDERHHFTALVPVPAVVVTSAVGQWLRIPDPDRLRPLTPAEADSQWQQFQREWAARMNATHVVAHSAGHCVHEEAPELVAHVVDAVVIAARTRGSIHLDPATLDQAGGRFAPATLPQRDAIGP